jgi:alkanesulfonate monooxygenase SsuD/methylene tetrahydromethanopterin reductase-like flavin-dependent oxidoreductase (luciferase family)
MQISLGIAPNFSTNEVLDIGQLAESLGFETLWIPNILDGKDPYPALTAVAQSTSRLKLGIAAISPWEAHPVKTALPLLTLNEVSSGRAKVLISGGGEFVNALHLHPERRVRAVQECIEIIKGASETHPFNYQGELFNVTGFDPNWATSERPRVLAAANAPMMLRMSAKVADGIVIAVLPPEMVKSLIDDSHLQLTKNDRSPGEFHYDNWWPWHVKPSGEAALREARQWISYQGIFRRDVLTQFMNDKEYDIVAAHEADFYRATHTRSDHIEGVPDALVDRIIDNLTSTGSLDELDEKIDFLTQFKHTGLNGLTVRFYGSFEEHMDAIKIVGEHLIPKVC